MTNSADPDQLEPSDLDPGIWIYTVCKSRVYPHSTGPGLNAGMITVWNIEEDIFLGRLFMIKP